MCTVDAEPDLFATKQRTHTCEWKPEVSQCLSVTRMHDVDCFRCFSNDCQAEISRGCGCNRRETGKPLSPEIILFRTSLLSQQRQPVVDREHLNDALQTGTQKRDSIEQRFE